MHSEFSPSQLSRIIGCPGSIQLYRELNPVQQESSWAQDGTMCHEFMEKLLNNSMTLQDIDDPEQRRACQEAWNYVQLISTPDCLTWTERQVRLAQEPRVSGTADVIIVNKTDKIVHVLDYKFGGNIFVQVRDNPQFLAYALGALDTLHLDTTFTIRIHVVQPRMDNFDSWDVSYDFLQTWLKTVLQPALANAESENPLFKPSETNCRWCLCKAMCKACHASAQEAAKTVFAAYKLVEKGAALSKEELLAFYEESAVLEAQIKAVKEFVMAELLRGHKMPGYKLVYGRANRKYIDETRAAKYLMETYDADPDDIYDTKFKSPAQIEKIIKEVKKDSKWMSFIEVPQGSPKVVKDDEVDPEKPNPFSSVTEKKV